MRLSMASIAIVSALTLRPYAVHSQMPIENKDTLPHRNQVYVKIIWPSDPDDKTSRPLVESWIAKQLKKRGQPRFTAATDWVPLGVNGDLSTPVWDGTLEDKGWACSVNGQIAKRSDGRVEVILDGWGPTRLKATISLADEPGSRELGAVERVVKTDQGMPYVAVLISPAVPEVSARKAGEARDPEH